MPDPKKYMTKMASTEELVPKEQDYMSNTEAVDVQYELVVKKGFKFGKNTFLTEFGRQMIKNAFKKGIIIDLKHFHKDARKQILDMAEMGEDFDPLYNIYGNPQTDDNGDIIAADAISKENHNVENERSDNKYQVMVTHAALSFVDYNGTNVSNVKDIVEQSSVPFLYLGDDFETIERDLKIIVRGVKFKAKQTPGEIKGDILKEITDVKTIVLDDKTEKVITFAYKSKLKSYLEFFLPLLLRECDNIDNLNIDNHEIARIIELGGVIGFISEDRVIRTNERMISKGRRASKNFPDKKRDISKLPYNINVWPMYGDKIVDEDKYLLGKPFNFDDLDTSPRMAKEDEMAFNQLFPEIQKALNTIYLTSIEAYKNNKYKDYLITLDLPYKLFEFGIPKKFHKTFNVKYENFKPQASAGIEGVYKFIDQIARVARGKVYKESHDGYLYNADDFDFNNERVENDDSFDEIKRKIKLWYQNISISSDFDGITDPVDLFASPRMMPVMALYVANRLKWDLYRRYCVKGTPNDPQNPDEDPWFIVGNDTIGPEKGQTLDVNEGYIKRLNHFANLENDIPQLNSDLNLIVKEVMTQILSTNFINMVAKARGWE
ncbi:MAG: hypothetical protein ACOC3T_02540 [Bacteroidota bacterium]